MSDKSAIEWTDATWNPTVGCSIVSPGCTNCYAMKQAHDLVRRFDSEKYRGLTKVVNGNAVWTGEVRLHEGAVYQPLKWRKPRRIFVNSMSDLFHEAIPDVMIDEVFAVMALCPQHTFQVLTKRAERMRAYMATENRCHIIGDAMMKLATIPSGFKCVPWPLPNVWLGISAERQEEADERIPLLLATPAAIRFVSVEPLLGPIDLTAIRRTRAEGFMRPLDGRFNRLDWIIVGGESGKNAREHDLEWSRSIIAQCKSAGVAVFEKQLGSAPFSAKDRISYRGRSKRNGPLPASGFWRYLNHSKGGDWSEWPEDLRVREFPVTDVSVIERGSASHETKTEEPARA